MKDNFSVGWIAISWPFRFRNRTDNRPMRTQLCMSSFPISGHARCANGQILACLVSCQPWYQALYQARKPPGSPQSFFSLAFFSSTCLILLASSVHSFLHPPWLHLLFCFGEAASHAGFASGRMPSTETDVKASNSTTTNPNPKCADQRRVLRSK